MEQIFISFRTHDTDAETLDLLRRINQEFGENTAYVFNVANDPGEKFRDRLRVAVSRAKVVIALIGPNWSSESGDQEDWVLTELEDALSAGIPVIPVLIRGAKLPTVASPKLQRCFRNVHHIAFNDLRTAEGERAFFGRLARRYRVRKSLQSRQWPFQMGSLLPNVARFLEPRQLLLHGARGATLRMLEASLLLLLSGYAVFLTLSFIDYTTVEIDLKLVTLDVLSLTPVALACFLFVALPFMLVRREHILDAFVAAVSTVAAFIVMSSPPSILIAIQLKSDYGLDSWGMHLKSVGDDRDARLDVINRFPDYVDNAYLKLFVIYVVGLLCLALYARWVYKLARVLRVLLRVPYTWIYFFCVLLLTPIMGLALLISRLLAG